MVSELQTLMEINKRLQAWNARSGDFEDEEFNLAARFLIQTIVADLMEPLKVYTGAQ